MLMLTFNKENHDNVDIKFRGLLSGEDCRVNEKIVFGCNHLADLSLRVA